MTITKPLFRCVRPWPDGEYMISGRWMYVTHPDYAPDASYYIRAFSILQADLLRLFEYVEPADANESTYSFRCLELLVRACGEVEANCRVILEQNGYPARKLTMDDYRKLNATHRLSSYRVRLPVWTGARAERTPFAAWTSAASLPWFKAHHGGKHNRHSEFASANLGHAVDAVAAVFALLSAQFLTHDYGPVLHAFTTGREDPAFEDGIGGYFKVAFPTDWPANERYDFDWQSLSKTQDPFAKLSF